ncbi:MAG: T9SS type A sorting domain-containing protein [Bacteroidia bacterium]|nr:T9SS type A sorting domain-containing protein [Bacteroidia bacterium]
MNKLVLNIVFILIGNLMYGQILSPMGLGLPYVPDKIVEYKDGIVVAYDDREGNIELQIWNGHFWNKINTPNIPRTGIKTDGEFKIIDLLSLNEKIYLAIGYENRSNPTDKNLILEWSNNKWADISNPTINEALSLKQFFVEDNEVKCLGKFSTNNTIHNILSLKDGNWLPEGNTITNTSLNDTFKSAIYLDKVLYATGNFNSPSTSNISLVTWDGLSWKPANYPPFLGENITLGRYNDDVVIYGKSNFTTSKFKINRSGTWQDISTGLTNITIEEVEQFAELNDNLFALGNFTDTIIKENYNLLVYANKKWQPTTLNLSDIKQLYSWKESVILSGDFTDNSKLNFIGEVFTDRAQLTARVFEDKNSNCKKEADEPWLSNYPIKINNINMRFQTDNSGQLYLHVDKNIYNINAEEFQYYTPTCPDVIIQANKNKTYYGTALGVNQKVGVSDAAVNVSDKQSLTAVLGDQRSLSINVNNIGSQPITNAELKINLGQSFDLISSQIPFQNFNNNVITYSIDLSTNESLSFEITCNVKDLEDLVIQSTVNLNKNIDQDLSNNSTELAYQEGVTLPNKKYCFNGDNISSNEHEIKYKIGIQNTTEQKVVGITLVDELDPNIIVSQQGIAITTSHSESKPITTYEYSKNINGEYRTKLITRWKNINLESHNANEESSKAFADYTIHTLPEMLNVGQEVCNTALIYLSYSDGWFEEPNITNTVCSKVEETLGVTNDIEKNNINEKLSIGPNPANTELKFFNSTSRPLNLSIINSFGQNIIDFKIDSRAKKTLNVKEIPSGVYMIFSDSFFSKKIIIN